MVVTGIEGRGHCFFIGARNSGHPQTWTETQLDIFGNARRRALLCPGASVLCVLHVAGGDRGGISDRNARTHGPKCRPPIRSRVGARIIFDLSRGDSIRKSRVCAFWKPGNGTTEPCGRRPISPVRFRPGRGRLKYQRRLINDPSGNCLSLIRAFPVAVGFAAPEPDFARDGCLVGVFSDVGNRLVVFN